jgi:hypothetical protein
MLSDDVRAIWEIAIIMKLGVKTVATYHAAVAWD